MTPHRRRRPSRTPPGPLKEGRRSAQAVLRELEADTDYLAFKQSIGEVLSESERARLEAARSGSGSGREGGDPQ